MGVDPQQDSDEGGRGRQDRVEAVIVLLLGVAVRPLVEDGVVALVRAEVDVDEGEQRARPGVGRLEPVDAPSPFPLEGGGDGALDDVELDRSRPGPVRVD
mgnify:CR=1 FL=1